MSEGFRELEIPGVLLHRPPRFSDARGWLVETWRVDWPCPVPPQMAYVSLTRPGVARGPHEHRDQSDFLGFVGPGEFRVYLWDNRPASAAFGRRLTLDLGQEHPGLLVIPPGVVHAYRNTGAQDGVVVNFPDKLFAGRDHKEKVDEIRHENDPGTKFRLEE